MLKTHFQYYGLRTRDAVGNTHVEEGHDLSHEIRGQYQKYLEMASYLGISHPTRLFPRVPEAQDFTEDQASQTLYDTIALLPGMVDRLEQLYNGAREMLNMLQENSAPGDIEMADNYSAFSSRARSWHMQLSELDQNRDRANQSSIPLDFYESVEPESNASSNASSNTTTGIDAIPSTGIESLPTTLQ